MKSQKTPTRKVLRLRQLRQANDMTQAELGRRVHLTPSMINTLEKGTRNPSFETALNLAKVFNVSVEELFSYVEVMA